MDMRQCFKMADAISKNVMIASIALLIDEEEERIKTRSTQFIWTRLCLLRRKIDGAFHIIFAELREGDAEGFKGYVRMDLNHFDELVNLLGPFLHNQDTNMRECIKPEEMCCITLR